LSEYAEELYEDHLDFDLDDDLYEDDVEDVDDRAAEVSSIVAQWERENGIELTDADFNEMGIRVAVGIDPDEAFAATDQGQREADFADLVDRIETVENRALTETEIDRLAQRDELAQLRGETDIDPSEALYDLDSSEGIATYIGERLSVPQEREEASAVQLDADGEEVPSFNVEVRNERVAAIDAAMSGEAVSVHDSTYDLESDDE
jgi:hypothetical protein